MQEFTLLIETSTERGMICFLDKSTVLFHEEFPFGLNNSTFLIPAIDKGLKELQISTENLNCIGVGIGPGSYTGIRVGAITAKAIAFANKIPLVGICTMMCFVPEDDGPFAVLIDAKIGGAYVITGVKDVQGITYTSKPQVSEIMQLEDSLRNVNTILTPQSKILRNKIEEMSPERKWDWVEKAPDPEHMNQILEKKLAAGEVSLDGHLELMYLRKTQAEESAGK